MPQLCSKVEEIPSSEDMKEQWYDETCNILCLLNCLVIFEWINKIPSFLQIPVSGLWFHSNLTKKGIYWYLLYLCLFLCQLCLWSQVVPCPRQNSCWNYRHWSIIFPCLGFALLNEVSPPSYWMPGTLFSKHIHSLIS